MAFKDELNKDIYSAAERGARMLTALKVRAAGGRKSEALKAQKLFFYKLL